MLQKFQGITNVGLALATIGVAMVADMAHAQLQLPGAFTPAPAGSVAPPPPGGPQKKAVHKPPAAPRVPPDEAVLGRTLTLNGRLGVMEFSRNGKDLQVSRLKLAGDQISRVGERCEVDLSSSPIALAPADKPNGVTRYNLDLPACPFSIDILDGAVLAVREGGACELKAADCRVDPAGLWGQPASEIGPKRAKEIEQERRRAEQGVRDQFKEWLRVAGKDRAMVTRIAHEQAAFSSRREELCRNYARESEHGYCALVATHARMSAIAAHVLPPEPPPEERPPAKARGKRAR